MPAQVPVVLERGRSSSPTSDIWEFNGQFGFLEIRVRISDDQMNVVIRFELKSDENYFVNLPVGLLECELSTEYIEVHLPGQIDFPGIRFLARKQIMNSRGNRVVGIDLILYVWVGCGLHIPPLNSPAR